MVCNAVHERVLGDAASSSAMGSSTVTYFGKFKLQVGSRFLEMNGHELEDLAFEAYPHLKRFQTSGILLIRIVDAVVDDYPSLCPVEIIDALKYLCEKDI
jgi:hypothetical protein